ncbi:MAG: OadG family protein [Bacteroidales bacterium]|nr:OadG family protein [Bacteroidales bacterium]
MLITATAMSVVFVMLLLLAVIFTSTGKYFIRKSGQNKEKQPKQVAEKEPSTQQDEEETDIPAIATALYLFFDDQHEVEQTGFWLNRSLNQQTAWSAKHILFKKSPIRKK